MWKKTFWFVVRHMTEGRTGSAVHPTNLQLRISDQWLFLGMVLLQARILAMYSRQLLLKQSRVPYQLHLLQAAYLSRQLLFHLLLDPNLHLIQVPWILCRVLFLSCLWVVNQQQDQTSRFHLEVSPLLLQLVFLLDLAMQLSVNPSLHGRGWLNLIFKSAQKCLCKLTQIEMGSLLGNRHTTFS